MKPQFLDSSGCRLAYCASPATRPGLPHLLFLGGFRSDMTGTKASWLEAYARSKGYGYTRFDYSGHGQSDGAFEDCTFDRWLGDALTVFDRLTGEGKVLVIGSSMGGWIGLHLALRRTNRILGLIGIAAAPDFTKTMIETRFNETMRRDYRETGRALVPNAYSTEPYIITRALIESGDQLCLLDNTHDLNLPMHLIQGLRDDDVEGSMPQRIEAAFPKARVTIHLIGDGDHSLSRPQDLDVIASSIESLISAYN